ncbi:hypothetical protein SynBIOSE41_02323 [Synechococcus sp. BIOS-E4-1]|nr:hypothetical protein SynBIOSE41_02323 [Synechococcus sp. BIOS-E4-1]
MKASSDVSLLIKAPTTAGAFYFFNHPKQPTNQPSIPGMIERSNCSPKTLLQSVAITTQQT